MSNYVFCLFLLQIPIKKMIFYGSKLGSYAFLFDRYKRPFYVTECGLSCNDHMFLDGQIHDTDRSDFLHRYLLALHRGCDRADVHSFSTGRRPTILSGTAAMPSASA